MLIAGAMVFNYVITVENIPKTLAAMLKAYELTPVAFLLLANLILLVLGCFLEGTTIILVILPVLLPTAQALGVDPVHFGVIAVINIMIGLVTPPYGLLLFMMTKIADVPLRDIVREEIPFLLVMLAALLLITFVPDIVLFLPRLHGLQGLTPPGAACTDAGVARGALVNRRGASSAAAERGIHRKCGSMKQEKVIDRAGTSARRRNPAAHLLAAGRHARATRSRPRPPRCWRGAPT